MEFHSNLPDNGKWIDLHSHFLPGIDDGSHSAEESLRMLRESARQHVGVMIATPHFYANQNSPERFLRHRAAAFEQLLQAQELAKEQVEWPAIFCGAEVAYFTGMSNCEALPQLCIEGTNILLLEMPFCRWSNTVMQDVYSIRRQFGIQLVIAHIERYIDEQPAGTLDEMLNEGILIQANAESFLHWMGRGRALRRVQEKKIHFISTDCHNMTTRPPDMAQAMAVIEKKCGEAAVQTLRSNAWHLLANAKRL